MSTGQLLVITKAPIAGRSKTRLTPPCSPAQAAAVARAALGDTFDAVRASDVARRVVALEGTPDGLDLSGCVVFPQAAGNLGDRLAAAFADAMTGPDADLPTLLIGTDTPQVTAGLLDACLARLVAAGPGTAALGVATDGGWWALGLHSSALASVLPGIAMSRDDTAGHTRRALADAGVRVVDLPELTDIDHFPDAVAVAELCDPGSRTRRTVEAISADLASARPPGGDRPPSTERPNRSEP